MGASSITSPSGESVGSSQTREQQLEAQSLELQGALEEEQKRREEAEGEIAALRRELERLKQKG